MAATPTGDLLERLKDPEYAKLYGEESAKVDFAITLTKARKSLNITQRGLAEKLNISQPYVAKLEGGEANPTLGTIGRLLASINLRLVTLTAPLRPEPIWPFQGFMSFGAADAGNVIFCGGAVQVIQEGALSPWEYVVPVVGTGGVGGAVLTPSVRSERREAYVGGAA